MLERCTMHNLIINDMGAAILPMPDPDPHPLPPPVHSTSQLTLSRLCTGDNLAACCPVTEGPGTRGVNSLTSELFMAENSLGVVPCKLNTDQTPD
ncbi:hypothetical protein ACOMHN_037190 [Nucella lapillus]